MDLDEVLAAAREAPPGRRIEYRDALVAFGPEVIARISPWLTDARLGAFAVRVLDRVGLRSAERSAVIEVLVDARDQAGSDAIRGDIDDAVGRLGRLIQPGRVRGARVSVGTRPIGTPGKPGRRYWAMHTWERSAVGEKQRAYIWAEVQRGRMRQGWGWDPEQDLNVIARARHEGRPLTDVQHQAWRAHPMLGGDDGMQYGDPVVLVAVPEWNQHVIVEVVGPYEFDVDASITDYGHLLPVRLVAGPIGRYDGRLSPTLRHALNNRTRLWRIDRVGGHVEAVVTEVN